MSTLAPHNNQINSTQTEKLEQSLPPLLLLFSEFTSGQSRRLDGFVSHVLQRRHNHGSFRYRIIEREKRQDLFERFHVDQAPTLIIIDDGAVRARLAGFHRPCDVERLLEPWLH